MAAIYARITRAAVMEAPFQAFACFSATPATLIDVGASAAPKVLEVPAITAYVEGATALQGEAPRRGAPSLVPALLAVVAGVPTSGLVREPVPAAREVEVEDPGLEVGPEVRLIKPTPAVADEVRLKVMDAEVQAMEVPAGLTPAEVPVARGPRATREGPIQGPPRGVGPPL